MSARGQAVVETTLGLLVFVIILIFAIHFGEMAVLSLKLREAAAGAMWDATAHQMHELPGNFRPQAATIAAAGPAATTRYEDFDGRSSRDRGKTVTQVFTSGTSLTVTCAAEPQIAFGPAAVRSGVLRNVYRDSGGMRCVARATLSAWQMPRSFVDDQAGGFFKAPLATAPMHLCSPGRGGARCGGAAILLDDWGLAGPEESVPNPLNDCSQRYCRSVQAVFDANGGVRDDATATLGRHALRSTPPLPGNWLSFRGEESSPSTTPFAERLAPRFALERDSRNSWPTTPGAGSPVADYDVAYRGRSSCFLGAPCQ